MKLKKWVKVLIVSIIIIIIVVIASLFFLNKKPKEKQVTQVKIVNEITEYGYNVTENKDKSYRNRFQDLKKVLEKEEIDEEEYVKIITELFIKDFYTLEDKITNTDIGGTQFVHSAIKENFIEKANNTLYKYVESNLYGERKQELPYVDTVTIANIEKKAFEYNDQTDDNAYYIKASWQYKKDLGYETEATLVFVHENNKLSLVEMD